MNYLFIFSITEMENVSWNIYKFLFKTVEKHHELVKSVKNGLSDKTPVPGGETLFMIECATIFSKFKN